jgi:hypothetical protein
MLYGRRAGPAEIGHFRGVLPTWQMQRMGDKEREGVTKQ